MTFDRQVKVKSIDDARWVGSIPARRASEMVAAGDAEPIGKRSRAIRVIRLTYTLGDPYAPPTPLTPASYAQRYTSWQPVRAATDPCGCGGEDKQCFECGGAGMLMRVVGHCYQFRRLPRDFRRLFQTALIDCGARV